MDLTHGKYLGVDYGDRRTGLAECDASGFLASGICTISESGMRHTAERVAKVIRAFALLVAEYTAIPIDFYDERMTTMQAYRFLDNTGTFGKKRKAAIDTLSAEIILQNYIDRERNMTK